MNGADAKVGLDVEHEVVNARQGNGRRVGQYEVLRGGRVWVIAVCDPDDRSGYAGENLLDAALVFHCRRVAGPGLYQSAQYSGSIIARPTTLSCLS